MNLSDFDKDISKEFGMSKKEARRILSFLQKRMKDRILFGVEIKLREIGTLTRGIRQPKPYLNLQTNKMEVSNKSYFLKLNVMKTMADLLKKKIIY